MPAEVPHGVEVGGGRRQEEHTQGTLVDARRRPQLGNGWCRLAGLPGLDPTLGKPELALGREDRQADRLTRPAQDGRLDERRYGGGHSTIIAQGCYSRRRSSTWRAETPFRSMLHSK